MPPSRCLRAARQRGHSGVSRHSRASRRARTSRLSRAPRRSSHSKMSRRSRALFHPRASSHSSASGGDSSPGPRAGRCGRGGAPTGDATRGPALACGALPACRPFAGGERRRGVVRPVPAGPGCSRAGSSPNLGVEALCAPSSGGAIPDIGSTGGFVVALPRKGGSSRRPRRALVCQILPPRQGGGAAPGPSAACKGRDGERASPGPGRPSIPDRRGGRG